MESNIQALRMSSDFAHMQLAVQHQSPDKGFMPRADMIQGNNEEIMAFKLLTPKFKNADEIIEYGLLAAALSKDFNNSFKKPCTIIYDFSSGDAIGKEGLAAINIFKKYLEDPHMLGNSNLIAVLPEGLEGQITAAIGEMSIKLLGSNDKKGNARIIMVKSIDEIPSKIGELKRELEY